MSHYPLFQYPALVEPFSAALEAPAETVTLDKWFSLPVTPVIRPGRTIGTDGAWLFEPSLFAETVTLDKWYFAPSVPIVPDRQILGGEGTAPPAEFITLDKWLGSSDLICRPPQRISGFFLVEPLAEEVALDQWFSAPPAFVHRTRPRWADGGWLVDPSFLAGGTNLGDWYVQTAIPTRKHLWPIGCFLVEESLFTAVVGVTATTDLYFRVAKADDTYRRDAGTEATYRRDSGSQDTYRRP